MEKTGFENLRVYQLSEELADIVWDIVMKWRSLAQDTIGKQLINSADSIGANIAEGTGRGSFADNRRFARIARGSLFELKHWLRRAHKRNLLDEAEKNSLQKLIEELTPKLSAYINSIGKKGNRAIHLAPDHRQLT
jgi:four helix bundle protein